MKILMILAIAAVIAAAVIVIEIYREVHHFCITHYTVQSSGLRGLEKEIKILFLSDLHNRAFSSEVTCWWEKQAYLMILRLNLYGSFRPFVRSITRTGIMKAA